MPTLLLRLEGPLQSWGIQSRFLVRDTGLEPSKSGVIGLLCAALGKPREERPEHAAVWPLLRELAGLRMGVRVDRPGTVRRDYHVAGGSRHGDYGVAKADGTRNEPVVSQRYYLADAAFLVGLETDGEELLARLHRAVAAPVWALSLGRKACVPSAPVHLPGGLRREPLEEALTAYPWLEPSGPAPSEVELVLDATPADGEEVRPDVPVDFAARLFSTRHIKRRLVPLKATEDVITCTSPN